MTACIRRSALLLLATTVLSLPAYGAPHFARESAPAASGHDVGIVAVVGGDAISTYDLNNRLRFIITTAHLSDTPDVMSHIRPQVIRSLIDEKLQLQEADKNNIKVSQADIDQAIAAIEAQRGMPPGTITHILDDNHIPRETFTQQIHAQLAWSQLLSTKVRPLVHVSDEEIAMASHRFIPPAPKKNAPPAPPVQELKIAVITLPVDRPNRVQEIKRLGDKLVHEVRGGANFEEVSRQFSSATASSGGKVEAFWIKLTQLEPNIAKILSNATPGMVTDPLRSSEGFTIIKVYDVHAAASKKTAEAEKPVPEKPKGVEVTLKEILLKLKPDAPGKEADMMLQMGEEVAKNPGTCEEKGIAGIKDMDDFDIDVSFRTSLLSDLPPAVKIIAGTLKTGEISTPFASPEGIRLYMLCGKKDPDANASRDEIYHMLMQQKMELEAQKYLRNLRRDVFIDVR